MFGGLFMTCCIVLAYLLGSVSCAILVCRVMGLPDPRTQGSNNPGATNVLRLGNKSAAAYTFAGDALKGFIPVLIAKQLGFPVTDVALIMLATFMGHLYPCFFQFKGGKGVATAIGCWLALAWPVGVLFVLTWLLIAKVFRISSLAALIATVLTPLYLLLFTNMTFTMFGTIMCGFLLYRHQQNIKNLLSGKEYVIGNTAKDPEHLNPTVEKPE